MNLVDSSENKTTKDNNSENVPQLEATKVLSVHCNLVNNIYQHDSGVLYTFTFNKSFGCLIDNITLDIYIPVNIQIYVLLIKTQCAIRIESQNKFDSGYYLISESKKIDSKRL